MKKSWLSVVGLCISVFLMWWVLKGEDYREIIEKISDARLGYLALSVLVGTLGYLIRALRWKILLEPMEMQTSLRSRFASVSMGFSANNLFPARIGEIVRAVSLCRIESLPVSGVAGSMVVERFLDSVAVFAMLCFVIMLPSFPATDGLWTGMGGSLMFSTLQILAGFLVILISLAIFPHFFLKLARRLLLSGQKNVGTKIYGGLESFLESLSLLRDLKLFSKALVWSFAFWLWHAWSFWLGFKAFGIEEGFAAAVFTMGMVGLAVAIPAGPGFFGTFQLGALLALNGVFNVTEGVTLAFAFGYHLGGFFPITFIGIYYAWKAGLSMKGIGHRGINNTSSGMLQ